MLFLKQIKIIVFVFAVVGFIHLNSSIEWLHLEHKHTADPRTFTNISTCTHFYAYIRLVYCMWVCIQRAMLVFTSYYTLYNRHLPVLSSLSETEHCTLLLQSHTSTMGKTAWTPRTNREKKNKIINNNNNVTYTAFIYWGAQHTKKTNQVYIVFGIEVKERSKCRI